MWFRVELNEDGSVISATQVDGSLKSGRHVFYIDCESKEAACVNALRQYQSYKERQREGMRATREHRRKSGKCTECGGPSGDFRWCEPCRKRQAARLRGELPPGAKQGKLTQHAQELRLQRAGRSQRLAILSECLEAAVMMRAGVRFISWLRASIVEAESATPTAAE